MSNFGSNSPVYEQAQSLEVQIKDFKKELNQTKFELHNSKETEWMQYDHIRHLLNENKEFGCRTGYLEDEGIQIRRSMQEIEQTLGQLRRQNKETEQDLHMNSKPQCDEDFDDLYHLKHDVGGWPSRGGAPSRDGGPRQETDRGEPKILGEVYLDLLFSRWACCWREGDVGIINKELKKLANANINCASSSRRLLQPCK